VQPVQARLEVLVHGEASYVPTAHTVHGVHTVSAEAVHAVVRYFPVLHTVHTAGAAAPPRQNKSDEVVVQAPSEDDEPTAVPYFPAAHCVHVVAAAAVEYVPGGH